MIENHLVSSARGFDHFNCPLLKLFVFIWCHYPPLYYLCFHQNFHY